MSARTCPYCGHYGTMNLYTDDHGDRDAECPSCWADWPIGPAPDPDPVEEGSWNGGTYDPASRPDDPERGARP